MRKIIFFICFLSSALVYGQVRIKDGLYNDGNNFMKFSANSQIETWNLNKDDYDRFDDDPDFDYSSIPSLPKMNRRLGTFSINNENGIDFISIRWDNSTTNRYLLLLYADGSPLLYTSDSGPYFDSDTHTGGMFGHLKRGDSDWIKASSSLTEGSVRYSTDKLGLIIGECWAEGVKDYGIGETLTLSLTQIYKLHISSGFVSFSKPHLFRDNTRIKRIKVTNEEGESEEILLRDTPHFQELKLKMSVYTGVAKKFKIEILEVYPGAKYTDTCINSIIAEGGQ